MIHLIWMFDSDPDKRGEEAWTMAISKSLKIWMTDWLWEPDSKGHLKNKNIKNQTQKGFYEWASQEQKHFKKIYQLKEIVNHWWNIKKKCSLNFSFHGFYAGSIVESGIKHQKPKNPNLCRFKNLYKSLTIRQGGILLR